MQETEARPQPPSRVELRGGLVAIRPFESDDAEGLLDLRLRNRDFFAPYEPSSIVVPQTMAEQLARLEAERLDWETDRGYVFGIFKLDGTLVGRIALSHVTRGGWQNAVLGYFVDETANGKGYATDAVRLAIRFAFERAGLHRLQAGVMPRNRRSIRVLEKAGFRQEGLSPRYLEINGVWEDHENFAITREDATYEVSDSGSHEE
jgi:[ribosomal protein S5]-alanine N-acetyltransferase